MILLSMIAAGAGHCMHLCCVVDFKVASRSAAFCVINIISSRRRMQRATISNVDGNFESTRSPRDSEQVIRGGSSLKGNYILYTFENS